MSSSRNHWAIVLAAGEGSRLRELTTRDGVATPKQYCSIRGGRSLLGHALERAARVVPRKRIVTIVAEEHRGFFEPELQGGWADLPPENLIVQPRNRGTAAGVLLPLLSILERDPEARVAVLPSDHFVAREEVISASLRIALESLDEHEGGLNLLGITPDEPEAGYGWIVPETSDRLLKPVACFVEKPSPAETLRLFAAGALWNSFLFACKARALIALYEQVFPELLQSLHSVWSHDPSERAARLEEVYAELETHDFSREILQCNPAELRLEIVPPCGWTDLGTPNRVRACLEALDRQAAFGEGEARPHRPRSRAALDLAFALEDFAGALGEHALSV